VYFSVVICYTSIFNTQNTQASKYSCIATVDHKCIPIYLSGIRLFLAGSNNTLKWIRFFSARYYFITILPNFALLSTAPTLPVIGRFESHKSPIYDAAEPVGV
jgi:hypothetical protein